MVEPVTDQRPPGGLSELHRRASEPPEGVRRALATSCGDTLVLGAGGKMGFHLSLMLRRAFDSLSENVTVTAVSRFSEPGGRAAFESNGIKTIASDLRDDAQLHALPDATNVFFLAGVKFGTSESPEILREFNVSMPQVVARRFAASRTVVLSTGCVYPFVAPASGGCTEASPAVPPGRYAESCLGREDAFRQASAESGTPVALIRLNYAVDLRYGVLVDIAMNILAGQPVNLTTGFVNVIWQGDALSYIVQALGLASSPPTVLNVTGEKVLNVREVAEILGELMERPVETTGAESPTAWLNDASQAHRLFGKPSVPEEMLIRWVADWVSSGRPTLGKPTRFEVRDGRF